MQVSQCDHRCVSYRCIGRCEHLSELRHSLVSTDRAEVAGCARRLHVVIQSLDEYLMITSFTSPAELD